MQNAVRSFRLAALAMAKEAVIVKDELEMIFLTGFILKFFNRVTFKLDDFSAFDANHVVVMATGTGPLKVFFFPIPR